MIVLNGNTGLTLNSTTVSDITISSSSSSTTLDDSKLTTKGYVDKGLNTKLNISDAVGQKYPNSTYGEIFNNYTNNKASGNYSHAEGGSTTASGSYSHAEGYDTIASIYYSHAEGCYTTASGHASHAEGNETTASGNCSHAGGFDTTASGNNAHTEGSYTTASGYSSHAEGNGTTASGRFSHAGGYYTNADQENQTAIGLFNTKSNTNSLLSVGNGTADDARSDAFVVKSTGEVIINSTASNTTPALIIGNDNIKKIINDLCYPVDSYFFYYRKVELVDGKPQNTTNTPLDYGTWEMVNDDNINVVGLNSSSADVSTFNGSQYIPAESLPRHSHQSIITQNGYRPTGSGGNPCVPAEYTSGTTNRVNSRAFTGMDIGYESNYTFYKYATQQPYHQLGYYLFMYKKTSLD